ncbi:MAG: hypothetical protein M3Z33_07150 [Actinomycetota bacterium]|nr:hypothetical protein [Actinomycetota bacterium]
MPVRTLSRALIAAATLVLLSATAAHAITAPAQTLDGPSPDIVDLGGVAMSTDGTAGLVYRKRVGGRVHVFASRYAGGRWQPAQQVDAGQRFDSSWPTIGAANDGQIVVTWVQEFGPGSDRLFSASLDRGATRFQAPIPLDLNVGEATETQPSLAMNPGGSAYLAYRVVTAGGSGSDPGLPPGYEAAEIRLARYDGAFWTTLGSLGNRNPAAPVRLSTPQNAPKVGVDVQGNGLLAFQEPDDEFVDRIWARRLFGTSPGIALLVSPQSYAGQPLRGPADQFSLDEAGFGEGAVAFRQLPGGNSALHGARVMVNTIPEAFVDTANAFGSPRLADGGGSSGLAAAPSVPAVGVSPDGAFTTAFGVGAASLAVSGTDRGAGKADRLDDGRSPIGGDPALTLAQSGASVTAWKVRSGGRGGVAIQELGADGVPDVRTVSAAAGGPVNQLKVAGSRNGDGAVAFQQGNAGMGQIAASVVDAPPGDFIVQTPLDFVRAKSLRISWEAAPDAFSPVRYSVTVDDEVVRQGLRGRSLRLTRRELDDGVHAVKVIATDGSDQETTSGSADVKIDRSRPRVRIRRRGRGIVVRVSDGRRGEVSGLDRRSTRIAFGDGGTSRRRASAHHIYSRAGTFTVVVRARDNLGNRLNLRRRVRVG